jgi:predicted RNA binding protein YcfA (HicA-like mRNA interferase family)
MTGSQMCRTLEQHGWTLLRINGSHHIYGKKGSIERPSVPVHGAKTLKVGLIRYLLKLAGLHEDDI